MFDDFTLDWFAVTDDARLRFRAGGEGRASRAVARSPANTHHVVRVAPQLVNAGYAVVGPGLRGYGRSTAPQPTTDHAQASKRAMADDVVALMGHLGFDRFSVVEHDRGRYVAFRLAIELGVRVLGPGEPPAGQERPLGVTDECVAVARAGRRAPVPRIANCPEHLEDLCPVW